MHELIIKVFTRKNVRKSLEAVDSMTLYQIELFFFSNRS